MGHSDNTTSSSEEDNVPRTPPHAAPLRRRANTRSFTAPSKLPKLKSSTRHPHSPAAPQTRSSPVVSTTPLDWGSGGEWSSWYEEIKRRGSAGVSPEPTVQDAIPDEEEEFDESLVQSTPAEQVARALQSAIEFETTSEVCGRQSIDAEQSSNPEHVESSVRGRGSVRATSNDHQVGSHEPVAKVLKFERNADHRSSESGQSVIRLSPTTPCKPLAGTTKAAESAEKSGVPTSHIRYSPTTTGKSLASTSGTTESKGNRNAPSPQNILRSLIRGAHREMMYFTLPHELFSLEDLRQGLDYAFSMLQAALSKLAFLVVLHDEMTDVGAVHLRSWIAQIDHLDPQAHCEPRMFVMFESLSSGEIRIALGEMVQSRLLVEDEVKRVQVLLTKRLTDLETNEKSSALLSAGGACVRSLQHEYTGTADGLLAGDEAAWDAVFTAIMVVFIGALYFCVR